MSDLSYLPVQGRNGVVMLLVRDNAVLTPQDDLPNLPAMLQPSNGVLRIFEEVAEWMVPRDVDFLHLIMKSTGIPLHNSDKAKSGWTPQAVRDTFLNATARAAEEDILNNAL